MAGAQRHQVGGRTVSQPGGPGAKRRGAAGQRGGEAVEVRQAGHADRVKLVPRHRCDAALHTSDHAACEAETTSFRQRTTRQLVARA